MRLNILFAVIFTFSSMSFQCGKETNSVKNPDTTKTEAKEIAKKEKDILSVIGAGDIMMGSNYPSAGSLPPDDGKFLFDDVKNILQDADITCGNLEGTLLDKGGTPKKCRDSSGNCFSFRMPTRYADYLKAAGFDFMSLANNHSGDMGTEGRESTYETLEKNEISFAGTMDYPTAILESDGIKYGFAGFAPNNGTVSINNIEKAKQIISDLKAETDIVIVFFHGGAEGTSAQRVSGYSETYLGENRGNVYEFAHAVIDAGADVVFGSGPHVTRAIELYNNRFIAYSLGNFCTYGKFGLAGATGIAPIIKVYINKEGKFIKGEITPVKQIKRGFPVVDEDGAVIKTIQSLTSKDFPETGLKIGDDGKIERKRD